VRAKKTANRYLALMLAALVSVPLSLSGLWVNSAQANDLGHDSLVDYSLNLNGSSQYLSHAGPVLPTTGDFVVEAWIYDQHTHSEGTGRIISQGTQSNSVNLGGLDIMTVGSVETNHREIHLFYKCGSSCGDTISTGVLIPNNSWQHLALVTTGSSFDLYVNGKLAFTRTSSAASAMATDDVRFVLGRPWLTNVLNSEFKGKIDEVNVWTKPATISTKAGFETWIQGHMHDYVSKDSPGLLSRYDFNEGSGSTVFDRNTTEKQNLTLVNSPTFSDVKTSSITSQGINVVSFPRSYLTSSGGWTPPAEVTTYSSLVVAGGGAGGSAYDNVGAGGGGAGGFIYSKDQTLAAGSVVKVTVGQGGIPGLNKTRNSSNVFKFNDNGESGQDSKVQVGTAAATLAKGGGGGGASRSQGSTSENTLRTPSLKGLDGGSGGGSGGRDAGVIGGAGVSGQGNKGGDVVYGAAISRGSGGGGAGGVGKNNSKDVAGAGGPGLSNNISGSLVTYATGGTGGSVGGFARGSSGTANTGNGGGGGTPGESSQGARGGFGAAGVVIIAYDNRKAPVIEITPANLDFATPTSAAKTLTPRVKDGVTEISNLGTWSFSISPSTGVASFTSALTSSQPTVTVTPTAAGFAKLTATFTPNEANKTKYSLVSISAVISVLPATTCGAPTTTGLTANNGTLSSGAECFVRFLSGTGKWTIPENVSTADLLIVGAGGSGGAGDYGAGGGAGAMFEIPNYAVTSGSLVDVTVGSGGASVSGTSRGNNGGASNFGLLEALGGGAGGGYGWVDGGNTDANSIGLGLPGGSGGGTGELPQNQASSYWTGAEVGAAPSLSGLPAGSAYWQNKGGPIQMNDNQAGSGGGGAGGAGITSGSSRSIVGAGGPGRASSITGTSVTYAAGGSGGSSTVAPGAGSANTGNGGGGGGSPSKTGKAGGSGVVIARYDRSAVVITQQAIERKLTSGVLTLTPTFTVGTTTAAGTLTSYIADTSVATFNNSTKVFTPVAMGTTTLALTFNPTDTSAYLPSTVFVTVEITSNLTVSDAPVAVQAVKTAVSGEAKISWTAPSNTGGSEIQEYIVTANPSGETCVTAALECNISGLVPGVVYTFSVVAINSNNLGPSESAVSNPLSLLSTIPAGAICSKNLAAQNGITVEPAHGSVFYIDTGQGQEIDAGYIGYRVTSDISRSDLWVEVSGFTGNVLSLANPQDKAIPLGSLQASTVGTAYYLLKATGGTTVPQGHTLKVYAQKPTIGSPSPIYECGFSFVQVAETIKAAANKVDSITSSAVQSIGSTMTITVLGDSGTIGQGNAIDGRMFALIPAARSNWPTGALRLEEVRLQLYSNSARSSLLSEHVDYLRINSTTPHVSPNGFSASVNRQYYRATFTFRIIGAAASAAPIIPIAMISSGTQIKHTDVGSLPTGSNSTLNLTQPPVDMTVTKNAETTSLVSDDGTTTLSYRISLKNSGVNPLVVDEIIETPDSSMNFKSGSGTFNGTRISDAGMIGGGKLAFSGPFEVAAGATAVLGYQMFTTTCAPGGSYSYENIATAQVGSVIIGSAAATQSVVTVGGKCGETEVYVEVENKPIDPEVQTSAASGVSTVSAQEVKATLNGVVDPNGAVGLPIRFKYSQSPTLASGVTTIDMDPSVASAIGYGVSRSITSLTSGTPLLANTTYYYRLEINSATTGDNWILGEIVSFRTDPGPANPTATTLRANEIDLSTNQARLYGTINSGQVSGGAKARFDYGIATGGNCSAAPPTVLTANPLAADETLTSFSDTELNVFVSGLTANTLYCFRIVALHGTGFASQVPGSWLPFTTKNMIPQVISWQPIVDRTGSANDTTSEVELEPGSGSTITVEAQLSSPTPPGSNQPVTYSSVDTSICTVNSSGLVTAIAKAGTCTIVANKAGDADHHPADPIVLNIDIATPRVVTTSVPDGEYRQSGNYSTTLTPGGGAGSYTWALCDDSGPLPSGLTLSSGGVISGTPTQAGIFEFTVCVTANGVTSDPQTLTIKIGKAPLRVIASDATVIYGAAAPQISSTLEGLLFANDTVDTPVSCSSTYTVGTNAGTTGLVSSCQGGFDRDYFMIYVNGLVSVTPLAVTVTAMDATKYNEVSVNNTTIYADPTLYYLLSKTLPAGQTVNNLFSGGLSIQRANSGATLGTVATSSLPTGEIANSNHAITVSGSGTANPNYAITFVPANFLVQTTTKISTLIIETDNKQITFGTSLAGLLDATTKDPNTQANVASTCVYKIGTETITASTVLVPGNYTVFVECTTSATGYQNKTQGSFTINVLKKVVTITADTTQKWQGTPDPTFTRTVSNDLISPTVVADLGAINLVRETGETPGAYSITPSGASHPHYQIVNVPGKLYIAKITITVQEDNGVLTSRNVTCRCEGLKPNEPTTLTIFSTPTEIATVTSTTEGTCPFAVQVIPASVEEGNHTLQVDSKYPTSVALSTTRSVALLPAPPKSEPETPGNGGNNPNTPGSPETPVTQSPQLPTVTPETPVTQSPQLPTVTPGPSIRPGLGRPSPAPSPSESSGRDDTLARGPNGTVADLLAGPPLQSPPKLPGFSPIPGALAQNPANSTVDFGDGVKPSGSANNSSNEAGNRTLEQLAGEKIGGFAPGAGLRVEILGARTGARFVVADLRALDAVALIRAMEASITTQAADFSKITRVVRGQRPLIQESWKPEVRDGINEFFAAVGLENPRALIDLDLSGVENWVSISAEVQTYQPGSTVFLVATSTPIVLATAEVDRFGKAQLSGAMPVEALGTGEHRVRIVGIRSLDGVSVDDAGEIQLSQDLMNEIQRFDLGTQSTIALSGLNPDGGVHAAIRVVPLIPVAPWWTLWFIFAGFVLALGARYRRLLETPSRRIIAASGVLASALPAVIIGWVSTVTNVVWVGILLGLIGAVASWFMPERKKSSRSK
jgi:hypothetical protein